MDWKQPVLLAIGIVLVLVMLTFYVRSGKPLRAFVGTALPGVLSLVAINYAAFFTGVGLLVNIYTLFTAVFLGLPGVIGIFLLKMIWGL